MELDIRKIEIVNILHDGSKFVTETVGRIWVDDEHEIMVDDDPGKSIVEFWDTAGGEDELPFDVIDIWDYANDCRLEDWKVQLAITSRLYEINGGKV